MPNEEVKLYIPEQIVRELEAAAAAPENSAYTRNEIAVDIIRQCLPIWRRARKAFAGTFEDYLAHLIGTVEEEAKTKQ